jgi:hypothetical protein
VMQGLDVRGDGIISENYGFFFGCEPWSFCFHAIMCCCLFAKAPDSQQGAGEMIMKRETKTGPDRLLRMRKMFAAKGGILEEDYNYFTKQGESSPLSKETHKSAELSERPARARN